MVEGENNICLKYVRSVQHLLHEGDKVTVIKKGELSRLRVKLRRLSPLNPFQRIARSSKIPDYTRGAHMLRDFK